MMTTNDASRLNPAELGAAIGSFAAALQMASVDYDPSRPVDSRKSIGFALARAIQLVSALYPNKPSFLRPLNELLYGLMDLDSGKVVPLLKPAKVPHRPGNALSEELFRTIPAAAMTCLVDAKLMTRDEAAQDIARRLSRSKLQPITAAQIKKWREKMMEGGLVPENPAVGRYRFVLDWVRDWEPRAAVEFLIGSLRDQTSGNPKNPQA